MTLREENALQKTKIEELNERVSFLNNELTQLRKMIFGSRSERTKTIFNDDNQLGLFDKGNDVAPQKEEEQTMVKVSSYVKTKKKPKKSNRIILPSHLRREIQVIIPKGLDLDNYIKIGEDITEILAHTPEEIYVKQIVRPRFVLSTPTSDCDKKEKAVQQSPIPPRLIPRGIVDETLAANIIVEKFLHHTPVYRIIKKYKQAGINFMKPRNLHNWIHRSAEVLKPLYHLLHEDLLKSPYLQGDESTLNVLSEDKPGSSHTGYMWLIHNPENQTTLFRYDPSRKHQVAIDLFSDFEGILQADGYEAYESATKSNPHMKLIYCMAHARRKFVEAANSDPPQAQYFISRVGKLYYLEKQLRKEKADYETRFKKRQEVAVPILDELKKWLNEQSCNTRILPKSPLGKAIAYSLKRWEGLCAYAHDGKLEIDNNRIENQVRPLALGRKNYLFANNHETVQNIACLYSIVLTANQHGLCIHKYLEWLLRKSVSEKITADAITWLPHRLSAENKQKFLL